MSNKQYITNKLIKAVISHRKMSERFIGYVSYNLAFQLLTYSGTSLKPEKISVLEKSIVKLIAKGVSDLHEISRILGLDMNNDVESSIMSEALVTLRNNLQMIQGSTRSLSITREGIEYVRTGQCSKIFTRNFEIAYIPKCVDFTLLNSCLKGEFGVSEVRNLKEPLSLGQLRPFAESQASYMQNQDTGISLQSATLKRRVKAEYLLYVCFVQSIRDNSIRTIIYDGNVNSVIPELSSLFNSKEYLNKLLPKCIKKEVTSESLEETQFGDKDEEQINIEAEIIKLENKQEQSEASKSKDSLVGLTFNSLEFEKQLLEIFENHRNEEIWMVSPWIKKHAFLNNREPMIRKFLDRGGIIFVGYSESEREGEEMVDRISMDVLKRLDANYDKFYYAELPKFHSKNVIEYKKGKSTLYSGSFNILSFCIKDQTTHYRREEMTITNYTQANNKREEYLKLFAEKYVLEYTKKLSNSNTGDNINISKLEYLNKTGIVTDTISSFENKANLTDVNLVSDTNLTQKEYFQLANNILKENGDLDDNLYIQAVLSACAYCFDYYSEKYDITNQGKILNILYSILLSKQSFYNNNYCRFTIRKGKEDEKKSILNIICNGFNFEFKEISMPKVVFNNIFERKERISFIEENIQLAKYSVNERILYNSAKALDII